jgi:SAM-dependent methyltransferase
VSEENLDPFRVSADAYERWMGRYSAKLALALVDFAGVMPGMRVLDVGCGPGALTRVLTERLGPESVVAADPSELFVEACRRLLPGVEVVSASGEALPFADESCDATLSQLVVNFMHEPEAGVREMRRVTRPGGLVTACVWDYAGEMTLLQAFWRGAREVDPERAAATDETAIFREFDRDGLIALWRTAGLCSVRAEPLVVSASYTDFEDLWSPLPTGVGPAGAFCKALDEERRDALHGALRRLLEVRDGPFELTARAWVVAGAVDVGPRR